MPNKYKKKSRKKSVVKKSKPKRKPAKKQASSSPARRKKFSAKRKRVTGAGLVVETPLRFEQQRQRRGERSGDLQEISSVPTVNSQSVEELLDEGNALEAEVVEGVENAPNADQGPVRTREVPEDDVPEEYLDKDR